MTSATPERWQQVKKFVGAALELPADARRVFLEEGCGGDHELLREAELYLRYHEQSPDFMERPAFDVHGGDSSLGSRIGSYKLLRLLPRQGGMSTVYLAEREDLDKQVALKLIRQDLHLDPHLVDRFHNERQILAQLEHPHIARFLDSGTTAGGLPYFVMEYVEGEPIDQYCKTRGIAVRERIELFRKVCRAVQFAHQNLVVHRDLKPGNILVTADGEPKLLDFGIAKLLDPGPGASATGTMTSLVPMTLRYASPEQIRAGPVTTASDVYSLGVLLYEILTGLYPYHLNTSLNEEMAQAICAQEPLKPSTAVRHRAADDDATASFPHGDVRELRRRLAGDLDCIVLQALRKEPHERYSSAEQLAEDLRRHLAGLPINARTATFTYRAGKFIRRNKVRLATAVTLLLLLAVSFTATLRGTRQRERARQAERKAEILETLLEDLFQASDPDQAQGKSLSAREILDRGREMVKVSPEGEPEIYATMTETLGRVYRNLGDYPKARPLLEESLRLQRQVLGEGHIQVANSQHSLARLLSDMGDYAEAERLMRDALEIQRRHHHGDHLNLARGINDLATLLYDQGDAQEAEKLHREVLAMKRRLVGEEHPAVLTSMNNLAAALLDQREYDAEAEELYRQVLAIRRKSPDGKPTKIAKSLNNLGKVLFVKADYDEAEAIYRETLTIRQELLGPEHPDVATTLNNLGKVLYAQERLEAAEDAFREALAIQIRVLGEDHPNTAPTRRNLAALLLTRGNPAAAESLARRAAEVFQDSKSKGTWRIADAESVLGACLVSLGRYDEAEPLLISSHATLEKTRGRESMMARDALTRIIDLYEAWGRTDKADEYRRATRPRAHQGG